MLETVVSLQHRQPSYLPGTPVTSSVYFCGSKSQQIIAATVPPHVQAAGNAWHACVLLVPKGRHTLTKMRGHADCQTLAPDCDTFSHL